MVVEVVIYCLVVVPDFGDGIDSPLGQYPELMHCAKDALCQLLSRVRKPGRFMDFQVLLRSDCLFSSVSPPVPPHGLFPCRAGTGH